MEYNLNPQQQRAVFFEEGPLLVSAGAGSGKTRVITQRITHLIKDVGIEPWRILAITFTKKAAEEMKSRIAVEVGQEVASKIWSGTFHSMCTKILRSHIDKIGRQSNFSIYDTYDSKSLLRHLVEDGEYEVDEKEIRSIISKLKANLITPEDYINSVDTEFQWYIGEVYSMYEKSLAERNALDFDDLLGKTVTLLRDNKDVRTFYQNKFQYILVDEYQDTNFVQNELIYLLGHVHQNVCVVGDADQSIYRFRGADIQNILNFRDMFPSVTEITLDQNYRSTDIILEASNRIIENNSERIPKNLWTQKQSGSPIVHRIANDNLTESVWVAETIQSLRDTKQVRYSDIAILYRTNVQSRALEHSLNAEGVPYNIISGVGFYERMEIKDLLSYLRIVHNHADTTALERIINVPRRKLGTKAVSSLHGFARRNNKSLWWAIHNVEQSTLSASIKDNVGQLREILDTLEHQKDAPPFQLLETVVDSTGYLDYLQSRREVNEFRVDNVNELIDISKKSDTLQEFLESVSLTSDADGIDESDRVSLMTIHAAKGLEFPYVFIVGFEDTLLPLRMFETADVDVEEERRLCYVAMTRAREQLFISSCLIRRMWGKTLYPDISRFYLEIPPKLVEQSEED